MNTFFNFLGLYVFLLMLLLIFIILFGVILGTIKGAIDAFKNSRKWIALRMITSITGMPAWKRNNIENAINSEMRAGRLLDPQKHQYPNLFLILEKNL